MITNKHEYVKLEKYEAVLMANYINEQFAKRRGNKADWAVQQNKSKQLVQDQLIGPYKLPFSSFNLEKSVWALRQVRKSSQFCSSDSMNVGRNENVIFIIQHNLITFL